MEGPSTARPRAGTSLPGAFADPVLDAQAMFRCLLEAMAHPGRIVPLPGSVPDGPTPLFGSTFATALTLLDFETPLWLDRPLRQSPAADALRFHCGCPIVDDPARAAHALVADPLEAPPLGAFAQGTPEYPDRSTTLVLQVSSLESGGGVALRGPGIEDVARLQVEGLGADFWCQWAINRESFPLGVDVVLATADSLAALPRSISVVED